MTAKPIKVVLSLSKLKVSSDLQDGLSCRITAGGSVITNPVPFKEVSCFDIAESTRKIGVVFLRDQKEVARGEFNVPSTLSNNLEVETTEVLKSSSTQNGKPAKELNAEFALTFINSEAFKNKKTTSQLSASKQTTGSVTSTKKVTDRVVGSNTVSSRIDTGRSKSPARNSSKDPKPTDLDTYLNKVVDKHFEEAKNRVGRDLSETSDCLYLNKFNQVATSQLVNSSALSPSKNTIGGAREETDIDQSASPERLKDRFRNSSRSRSPGRLGAGPDMTSILMETETRRYVNEYKNQLEYLRNIVYVLDQKVHELESYQREVNNLRDENDKSNSAREELRKTLLETTKDLKEESDKFNRLVIDLEGQNRDILRDLKGANNKVDDLQTKLHAQEIRNGQLEAENSELRAKVKAGEAYKGQLQRLTNDFAAAEKRHADSLVQLGQRLEDLDASLGKTSLERNKLREENSRLHNANAELKVQLTQEKNNNGQLKDELDSLNNKLKVTQGSVEILKGIQEQRDAIVKEVNKLKHANDALVSQITEIEREAANRSKEGELGDRSNRDELLKLQRRCADLESQLNETRGVNGKQRKENIELRNHIITLEQLLCVKEDVYAQLESANSRLEQRQNDCDKLRNQTDANSKVVEGLNDKVIELEKLVIYLKNAVADKEDVNLV
jgi:chromosome segregation ATPase